MWRAWGYTVEICDDGIDNDGDTLVDSADPDCAGPAPPRDTDSDGLRDSIDNCDNVPNPEQEDTDSDGVGDACQDIPKNILWLRNGVPYVSLVLMMEDA